MCVGVLEGLNEAVLGHHGNCSMKDGQKVCVYQLLLEQMDG